MPDGLKAVIAEMRARVNLDGPLGEQNEIEVWAERLALLLAEAHPQVEEKKDDTDTRGADTQYPSNPFATAASIQTNVATVTPSQVSHEHYYSHWSVIRGIREDERREPTPKDFADPRFDVLWELLKHVDVHYETGLRSGVTGNDICAILDRLSAALPETSAIPDTFTRIISASAIGAS